MKTYYFAAYQEVMEVTFEVAVFEDEEARDKWVAFQDRGSIMNGEIADNCELHRVALDDLEAETCYRILEKNCNREADLLNDNMFWIS